VFLASIDVATKRLHLADAVDDVALRDDLVADAVGSGVSAFDTLGKELRRRYASVIPTKPKNPFQNLEVVARVLDWDLIAGPFGNLDRGERDHLKLMFQVRHIFEHNGGVVDDAFCRTVPGMNHLVGRRYPLNRSDADALLCLLAGLGREAVSRVQTLVDSND
jgi:hypothetical protein